MIHSIIPYDDIFPTEISNPHFVNEDGIIREYRDNGFGLESLSRIYATDLWMFLPPIY
ncbi:MAG TPA: hypothetical protein IAB67_03495 [Candidatus Ventrousia excrementavium]|uniref:Uncharacterized protein n=1 Tax=Candidatus Ventrousia excrementavium TaxID=2840961 RepID=A0A9D1LKP6_9CLOT|nr:hypothetical protein [Candidatus Ventrousia excrementavium]